jgi:hypothetical protein
MIKASQPFCACLPVPKVVKTRSSKLCLRTLTCDKLSHCQFDFDCPDFAEYYNEKYHYQEFTFIPSETRNMIHDPTAPESATSEDTILYVDKVRVNYI